MLPWWPCSPVPLMGSILVDRSPKTRPRSLMAPTSCAGLPQRACHPGTPQGLGGQGWAVTALPPGLPSPPTPPSAQQRVRCGCRPWLRLGWAGGCVVGPATRELDWQVGDAGVLTGGGEAKGESRRDGGVILRRSECNERLRGARVSGWGAARGRAGEGGSDMAPFWPLHGMCASCVAAVGIHPSARRHVEF